MEVPGKRSSVVGHDLSAALQIVLGYRILCKIPFLHEPADIVYSYLECFDDSGYPRGLKGDQIPLGARIVAIANTFDAITSDRCYPSGRREIQRQSGKQFDPAIVRAFQSISERIWQELRKATSRRCYGQNSN